MNVCITCTCSKLYTFEGRVFLVFEFSTCVYRVPNSFIGILHFLIFLLFTFLSIFTNFYVIYARLKYVQISLLIYSFLAFLLFQNFDTTSIVSLQKNFLTFFFFFSLFFSSLFLGVSFYSTKKWNCAVFWVINIRYFV